MGHHSAHRKFYARRRRAKRTLNKLYRLLQTTEARIEGVRATPLTEHGPTGLVSEYRELRPLLRERDRLIWRLSRVAGGEGPVDE